MDSPDTRPRTAEALFDSDIEALMKTAWRVTLHDPAQALFFLRTVQAQRRAARLRRRWEERGTHVPPLIIASIASRCNLRCAGCYSHALRAGGEAELAVDRLRSILAEAAGLGVSIVMLAGGEPLLRPDVLELAAEHPGILFPVFTNGLLIDDDAIARFRRLRNLIPVLSLEGPRTVTDDRRGAGVFATLAATIRRLSSAGIFLGTSLTVTGENVAALTEPAFIRSLNDAGCRLFFFVEYVPVQPGTERLTLTVADKAAMLEKIDGFTRDLPGLFIAFPGDEEVYGGCLAAGRGFVHLNATGGVEPCPFAPWSDATVLHAGLKEALASPFLARIRAGHERLRETTGGCALWAEREWAEAELDAARCGRPAG